MVQNLPNEFFAALPTKSVAALEESDSIEYMRSILDEANPSDVRDATEDFLKEAGMTDAELDIFYSKILDSEVSNADIDSVKKLQIPVTSRTKQSSRIQPHNATDVITFAPTTVADKPKTELRETKKEKVTRRQPVVHAFSQQSRFHTETIETLSNDVLLKDVNIIIDDKELLVDATLQFKAGVKYGLYGRNGVGKTTLLKSIADRTLIGFPRGIRVNLISQIQDDDDTQLDGAMSNLSLQAPKNGKVPTVVEATVSADQLRLELLKTADTLQQALEGGIPDDIWKTYEEVQLSTLQAELADAQRTAALRSGKRGVDARNVQLDCEKKVSDQIKKLAAGPNEIKAADSIELATILSTDINARLRAIGADSVESRAREILHGLGFSEAQMNAPWNTMSGGWRMRLSLAGALLIRPDVLLLDEPTNHLDIQGILWLIGYLNEIESTIVVVSHDRFFLNAVIGELIVYKNKKLDYHVGNYDEYELDRAEKRKRDERQKDAIDRKAEIAKKSTDRMMVVGLRSNDDKKIKQAKAKQKKLAERAGLEKNEKGHRFRLNKDMPGYYNDTRRLVVLESDDKGLKWELPEPSPLRHPGYLLSFNDVDLKYISSPSHTLHGISFALYPGGRIGLIGANGTGKSTLMNLAAGKLSPSRGSLERHSQLKIGYFSQHNVDKLSNVYDKTAVSLYLDTMNANRDIVLGMAEETLKEQDARKELGRFGLGGEVALVKVADLSGGQKVRLAFALAVYNSPNVLILDEPTAHVDLQTTQDAIIPSLRRFKGAIMVVSHDVDFIAKVVEGAPLDAEASGSGSGSDSEEDEESGRGDVFMIKDARIVKLESVHEYVSMQR